MEVYLFDKRKELIDIIPPEDLITYAQTQELNDLITSEVDAKYRESLDDAHFFGSEDVDDRSIFWRYKIDRHQKENDEFAMKGTYELFDDLKGRAVITDRRPKDWAASQALSVLLQGTSWKVGNVYTRKTGTSNWYYIKPLEAFWDFLDKWRVEFKPRMIFSEGKVVAKYIDIYDRVSGDYGKWYEYGDRLLTVLAEQQNESVFTAFYGRGKGEEVGDGFGRRITFKDVEWKKSEGDPLDKPKGQEYLEFPEATAEYGYEDGSPRFDVVEFSQIDDEKELLQAIYEYGSKEIRPKAQFKSTVYEDRVTEMGEIVTIVRDPMKIRYKTRVFKLNRDFLDPRIKTSEFGDKLIKSRAEKSKEVDYQIEQQEQQTVDWLEQIRSEIIDSYFNNDGFNYELKIGNEYDLPAGYYSFDAPINKDPTKVIYMGAGQLLIANSKLPNGDWDWKTAANGDGIVADVVNTGTLRAEVINNSGIAVFGDVNDAIENVDVGNRNFVLGSRGKLTLDSNSFDTVRSRQSSISDDFIELAKGKEVILSIEARSDGYELGTENPWIGFEFSYNTSNGTVWEQVRVDEMDFVQDGEWQRYYVKGTIDETATSLRLTSGTWLIRDTKGFVQTRNPMLEIGNKIGSDWTLAPEDGATKDELAADSQTIIHGGNIQTGKIKDQQENTTLDLTNGLQTFRHSDGSRTEIGRNGLRRFTSGDNRNYHYLISIHTFTYGDSSNSARWITLPSDFKGKDFKVYLAIADSLNAVNYRHAIQRFVCTQHPNHSIDYNNARVPVIAYKSETLSDGIEPKIRDVQGMLIAIY